VPEPPLDHRWYVHAIVHWLTGVSFAVVLALCIIVAGPRLPGLGGFLHNVEQRGIDYAMRLRVAVEPPAPTDDYVFIDIDAPYCTSVLSAQNALGSPPQKDMATTSFKENCEQRSPTKPAVIAAALTKALQARPRLILVDAPLWDAAGQSLKPDVVNALKDALKAQPSVPVVAASPYRPTGGVGKGATDPSGSPTGLGASLHFAPTWTWGSAADTDSVVRDYPATVEDDEQGKQQIPTLAFLAATEVDSKATAGCAGNGGRLLYTLPSLVPPDPAAPPDASVPYEARYVGHYDRYLASRLLSGDQATIANDLGDRIVIIGSSAVNALDRHESPLGPMAGPEIHLNALKSFLGCKTGFVVEPDHWGRASHEALIIAGGSMPFLGFWMAYFWLSSRAAGTRNRALLMPLVGASGFILAILAAMLWAVLVTLFRVAGGHAEGFSLEFFTPIFALSLEGFAEGARWLIDRIESAVERAVFIVVRAVERGEKGKRRHGTD